MKTNMVERSQYKTIKVINILCENYVQVKYLLKCSYVLELNN